MDKEDKNTLNVIAFQVGEMWDAMFGNGQPGILQRLTRVEVKVAMYSAAGGLISGGFISSLVELLR